MALHSFEIHEHIVEDYGQLKKKSIMAILDENELKLKFVFSNGQALGHQKTRAALWCKPQESINLLMCQQNIPAGPEIQMNCLIIMQLKAEVMIIPAVKQSTQ